MDGLHPNPAAESELEQAFAHHRAGRLEMAVGLYRRVLEQDLGNIQVLRPLGDALHDQGEHEAALLAYGAALEAEPGNLAAQLNLANTLIGVERYDEAQARSRRTLKLHPDCTPALANLGQALLKAGRPVGAVEAYEKRARLVPGDGKALNDLGVARQWTGDIEGAIRAFGQALEVDAGAILAERNLQIALLDCPGLSSEELFARHRELGRRHGRNLSRQRSFTPARERRLRVGYVSSDFHDHPVGRNILPLLAHHDRDAFEVFLYGENDPDDSMNPRFRSLADHWRDSTGMADEALAGLIEGDGIDVLVLLAGRFNANRPLVATYRPAPVQVSFHDCATSGLDEMDYWLTDHDLHPKDTPERFTEKLYRLDQFYQFEPPVDFPVPGPPPSVQNGFVSFGCFNKPEKINDRVIQLWAAVMIAVPDSRLMLKYRNYWGDEVLATLLRARFAAQDIDPERLVFLAGDDPRQSHLALYEQVDIALDPFPFNGATTSFEALAMGVPVIALCGRHFVDRVGGALLRQAGLGELAAANQKDYIIAARDLALDPGRLAGLRKGLRERLTASPLCNGPAYARSVEAAFREMST